MITPTQILGLPPKPVEDVLEVFNIAGEQGGIFATIDGYYAVFAYFHPHPLVIPTWFDILGNVATQRKANMRIWMGFYPYPVRKWIEKYMSLPIHTPLSRTFWSDVATTYIEVGHYPKCVLGAAWFEEQRHAQAALTQIKENSEMFTPLVLADILKIYDALFPPLEEGVGGEVPSLNTGDTAADTWGDLYLRSIAMIKE